MELLIVLGLCFGAYELLGVFQGCFHYNDHPLPYNPQAHGINSLNSGNNNGSNESKDNDNDNDNEQSNNEQDDENRLERDDNNCHRDHSKEDEEENLESLKSGPCSCYSTVTEDDYDDDTRVILRNSQYSRKGRRQQILRKPINKFSLSTSLMSLSREDTNFLFNYIDDVNSRKFSKFRSEIEISETSFSSINRFKNYNELSYNDNRRNCRQQFDVSSSDDVDETTTIDNNEDINCNASVNLDTNKKKIFFISAAS